MIAADTLIVWTDHSFGITTDGWLLLFLAAVSLYWIASARSGS